MPIWFQARCLRIETKRQQAAALQALRAYQRPLHPRQRGRNHFDQRALPCDGVAGDISQPGAAEGPGGARAGGVARQATLVPAAPGWEICELNRSGHSRRFCYLRARERARVRSDGSGTLMAEASHWEKPADHTYSGRVNWFGLLDNVPSRALASSHQRNQHGTNTAERLGESYQPVAVLVARTTPR